MREQVTNIYLVRHGQTTWNLEQRWQGSQNSDLTILGIAQMNKSKMNLEKYIIDYAFVSPSKRALESMKILLSNRNIDAVTLDDLREITLGEWEGKTHDEVSTLYPEEYYNYWHKPNLFSLHNAETYQELQKRMIDTLDSLFKSHEGSSILVVSHGVSIKVALAYYSNISISNLVKLNNPNNAEIITLQKTNDTIRIC